MYRADYVSALCAVFAASITPTLKRVADVVPVVHFLAALLSEEGEDTLYVKSLVLVVYYVVSVLAVPAAARFTPFVFFAADVGYALWFLAANGRTTLGGAVAVVVSGASSGAHAYGVFASWRRPTTLPPVRRRT